MEFLQTVLTEVESNYTLLGGLAAAVLVFCTVRSIIAYFTEIEQDPGDFYDTSRGADDPYDETNAGRHAHDEWVENNFDEPEDYEAYLENEGADE